MGIYNSSKTRVEPFFDWLFARDPAGESWLQSLIQLPELPGYYRETPEIKEPLLESGRAWGNDEYSLSAPLSLLEWLVHNLQQPVDRSVLGDGVTREKRAALLKRDPNVIREALEAIRVARKRKHWSILEGVSKPDVYLQTADTIIVIEGKRTEAGPTTATTWMQTRHQMLRHIDAAWDDRGTRKVFGFFMVEAEPGGHQVPQHWRVAAQSTVSRSALDESLPHRVASARENIAKAFIGVTTWQGACMALKVPVEVFPN